MCIPIYFSLKKTVKFKLTLILYRRIFANAHTYHINSISVNSDQVPIEHFQGYVPTYVTGYLPIGKNWYPLRFGKDPTDCTDADERVSHAPPFIICLYLLNVIPCSRPCTCQLRILNNYYLRTGVGKLFGMNLHIVASVLESDPGGSVFKSPPGSRSFFDIRIRNTDCSKCTVQVIFQSFDNSAFVGDCYSVSSVKLGNSSKC